MFEMVRRFAQQARRRRCQRRLRRTLRSLGVTPVLLRRRVWQLCGTRVTVAGLELAYRGPGGIWRLRLPRPDRASALDASAPGLTQVTVVFPDGGVVRCVGDSSDRFVPLPPHSDSVAALLPPMVHVSVDQLATLLDVSGVSLVSSSCETPGRHRRNSNEHAA